MQEAEFRSLLAQLFQRIEAKFENVDPDVVECEVQYGALTLVFPNKTKLILSAQPSVQQLWMAIASRGVAYHFNYDGTRAQWWDDKGQGIEVLAYLKKYLQEEAQLNVEF